MHINKIFLYIFSLSLLLFSCIKDDESEAVINYVNVNDQVPSFAVEDTAGNTFNSKHFLDKQSLLVFFGTYCSDCQKVLPVVEEVWKELKDDSKFLLVTISREESAETVSRYWKDNRFTMPFYLDPKHSAFELFANNTIPRIYIIGPDTKVVWMSVESLDLSAKELIQKIKGLK